eukprot:g5532.t1
MLILKCGMFSSQGVRDYQEDRAVVRKPYKTKSPYFQGPTTLLGVYDGHGGDQCSTYVSKRLPTEILTDLNIGMHPVGAFVNAHLATEVSFLRQEDPEQRSGSTAVTVVVDTAMEKLWVAHVGDSRALLIRKKGAAIALTKDHDAKNKNELQRIRAVGGSVDEGGYVNGIVATARAIGDYDAKVLEPISAEDEDPRFTPAVMPIPEVDQRRLTADDICIVLGCDGLFEAHDGSIAWINRMVKKQIKEGRDPTDIARELVQTAIDDGSEDNTTAVVAVLKRPG